MGRKKKQVQAFSCSHCNGKKTVHENLCDTHFKQLQEKWYGKLKTKGFEDIEANTKFSGRIADVDPDYLIDTGLDTTRLEAKREYYRLAEQFLYSHTFETETELEIWKRHKDGMGIREINKVLKGTKFSTYKDKVEKTIKKLRHVMLKEKSNGKSR